MKSKKWLVLGLISIVSIIILTVLSTFFVKKVDKSSASLDQEILRAMTYGELTDEDNKTQSDNVRFSAFFTRDLNQDGYAERIKGTCKELTENDTLYMELNVLTEGYLQNGRITLNAENFTWTTAIVDDNIVDGDYIGKTTDIKLEDKIQSGSQKLFLGTITSLIGENINDYSKVNSVTLTGTYVDSNGDTADISVTRNITVDWYGSITSSLSTKAQSYDIDKVEKDEENNSMSISFFIKSNETSLKLLLKENVVTATIPKLNGYSPINVIVEGNNVTYDYNKENSVLTIKRSSQINDDGQITTAISKSNRYDIKVTYPLEAYKNLDENSITLEIPVTGYYVGYNNPNSEFQNPLQSNIAEGIVAVEYNNPKGSTYNFEVKVGEYIPYRYVVSKQKPLGIYNKNEESTDKDYYEVRWDFYSGNQKIVKSAVMKESDTSLSDQFLNTENKYFSMENYTSNIGIYFSGAISLLGKNGYIKLYNDETNELIHTFTKDDWLKYSNSNPYYYESAIKHIRIETSEASENQLLSVYNIKEINDNTVTTTFTKDEFDKLSKIYSYLLGSVKSEENDDYESMNKIGIANYEEPNSNARIATTPTKISTQNTSKNHKITITTSDSEYNQMKWKNGEFLVKLPEEIISVNINNIQISNQDVKVLAYDVYEKDNCKFIKIITENAEEQTYTITINCDLTANPVAVTERKNITLYAVNEDCNKYVINNKDIYDVNSNNNFEELVGTSSVGIDLLTPSTLITNQTLTNYDDKNSVTVAPNVSELNEETRTANVNINLLNNYNSTISETKILGVIPFEGNSYIINKQNLGSEFSVTMGDTGIQMSEQLKDIVTVYYSENESATSDLNDSNNKWTKSPDDWTKVKKYLIDFGEYKLPTKSSYTFTYEIKIPEGISYNKISYSEHAVYFALNTEEGKLQTSTEPNKLGIRIVRKYDIDITKYKAGKSLVVSGASYKLTELDNDNNEVLTKIITSNSQGKLLAEGLYADKVYTLKEIKAAEDYSLSEDEIKFRVSKNEQGNLEVIVLSDDKFATEPIIENETLKASIEDEPKYKITITKKDIETSQLLKDVKFKIEETKKTYITNEDGQVDIIGLEQNTEYTLKELYSEEHYLNNDIKFKLVKDANGKLKFESDSLSFENAVIENNDNENLINIKVDITNEKIPTYNLQILKVEENSNENDVEKLKPLTGADFTLESTDKNNTNIYTTESDGYIQIPNLYIHEDGKYITGEYTLQEIKAPSGYSNNIEKIKFIVDKDEDNKLKITIENKENLETLKDVIIGENTVKLVIQDKPLFKLIKKDLETGELLANAKFIIYELDSTGKELDYAKDANNNYVGEKNEYDEYVVTTDENGTITLPLKGGTYKIVEIGYPEGYQEKSNEQIFKVASGKEENNDVAGEVEGQININSIEDLVDLSKNVNSGNSYTEKTIVLQRTLDFKEDSSYNNSNDISYGDLNGDGTIEGIKAELTNTSGCGFSPIGDKSNVFSGYFNGQGYEIRNIYINTKDKDAGLFGYVKEGKIENLGMTGEIKTWGYTCNVNVGGIAAFVLSSSISNCFNEGKISGTTSNNSGICYVGGIVGYVSSSDISKCYNTGEVSGKGYDGSSVSYAGGIVGSEYHADIRDCYNIGKVNSDAYIKSYAGGIIGYVVYHSNKDINNCYNKGEIKSNSFESYAGGIIGLISYAGYCNINDCYNTGKISSNNSGLFTNGKAHVGGIIGMTDTEKVNNCYNIGEVTTDSNNSKIGGIVGQGNNVNNCYYLETLKIEETENTYGNSVSAEYMQSKEFYDKLNVSNVWLYRRAKYPLLTEPIPINLIETTELTIENSIKKFKVTTDVNESNGVKGGSITGEDLDPFETIIYGKDSTMEIIMTPDSDYGISNITINGEKIDYEIDDTGIYKIPGGYFKDVQEDKHIVVTYTPLDQILIINKVDEQNPDEKLEGAKFSIEQISDEVDHYNEIIITNSYGQIRQEVPIGKYKITELEAPKGYTLNNTPFEFEVVAGQENIINITNKKQQSVIVHHYLKQSDGTYTTNKVAKDDVYKGDIGASYITSPHADLSKLHLEKDSNGNYVIPSNVTGIYTNETIEIIYYYEAEPINLVIHHYLDGTESKLADDRTEFTESNVTFDEDGNYKVSANSSYDVSENEEYNNLLNKYKLVSITSTIEDSVQVTDTLEYNTDAEISYYYSLNQYNITTEVKAHVERKTNNLTNEKEDVMVKGGTISGEQQQPYEVVEHGKNSTKEIVITPEENYIINKISLVSTKEDGAQNTIIIYGEGEQQGEISYTKNEDGSIKLSNFENVQENKHIIAELSPIPGTVIVHHYVEGTGEEFGNEAVKVPLKDGGVAENEIKQDLLGERYVTKERADVSDIYMLVSTPQNSSGIYEKNTINVYYYYSFKNYNYTIEHYYKNKETGEYEKDESVTDTKMAKYQDIITITEADRKVKTGYKYAKQEGSPLTITEVPENNIIKLYYDLSDYTYTVHYFYDGIEDQSKMETETAEYKDQISTYTDKVIDGYALEKVKTADNKDLPLTITENADKNIINVYYKTQFKITTDVIEHTETYKDGTKIPNIKGGSISGEDLTPYEKVFKGDKPQNEIKIKPDSEYVITKVIIKSGETEETKLDLTTLTYEEDGSLIIPQKYIVDETQGMQSNKHIEVEFRKKTTVIVQYLEKETKAVLYKTEDNKEYEEISGYETEKYTTTRKLITNYKPAEVEAVKNSENVKANITYNAEGNDITAYNDQEEHEMCADTVTVTYWYERIPSGIIVRHIELNEKDKKDGLTLESGIELESETIEGYVSLSQKTNRKIYNKTTNENEKYKDYISVEGPVSSNEDIIVLGKDDNEKTVTYKDGVVVEVRYYYERQYNIATKVKKHTEIIDGAEKEVSGGTISGDGLESYEKINKMASNENKIEIIPEDGYRVKTVTINDQPLNVKDMEDENHKITLEKGYFKEVTEDKNIVVEFEKIPAKVIVKYRDADTKEEVSNQIIKDGYVNDIYTTSRLNIETYIPAQVDAVKEGVSVKTDVTYGTTEEEMIVYEEQETHKMTETQITVTYWYTKQFTITTDVIEHIEIDKDENQKLVKGGMIDGEDSTPYETVIRGKNNEKEIKIKPDEGYRIKEIRINDEIIDYEKDENINIEENVVKIPEGYFNNIQEDKKITVEYEKIPAKVIIKYLDEETGETIYKTENGQDYDQINGIIGDNYKTKEKYFKYYELVKEKYPENSEGVLTKEDITVEYYYRKLKFNMKIDKEIDNIILNNEKQNITNNEKEKIEIDYNNANNTKLEVTYRIKVTNTEKIEGTAIIEEDLPNGFEFIKEKSSLEWEEKDGKYILKTPIIKSGEIKEYLITVRWNTSTENVGEKVNIVNITGTENVPGYEETTKDDNKDSAILIIKLNKTIVDDIKEITKVIKTGDTVIVSVLTLVTATIILVVINRRKM